jgi:hypothetical protein
MTPAARRRSAGNADEFADVFGDVFGEVLAA